MQRFQRSTRLPLQCYDSNLYATFDECERCPGQCIAPTAEKSRCKWKINQVDLDKAEELKRKIEVLPDNQERSDALADFVLLHCCVNQHRHKLNADSTSCLDRLIELYGAAFPAKSGSARLDGTSFGPSMNRDNFLNYDMNEHQTLSYGGSGMQLRSQVASATSGMVSPRTRTRDYFLPYVSDPADTIEDALLSNVPSRWAAEGHIYSFEWPEYPKYIKIGFTSRSVKERLDQWRSCHPGLIPLHTESVTYPQRIERLIHLEMAQHRYRIGICRYMECKISHEEWFELPANQVGQIIRDWAKLATIAPFYDEQRTLKTEWQQRLLRHNGKITAKTLLDLLVTEQLSEEAAPLVETVPSSPSPQLAAVIVEPQQVIFNNDQSGDLILTYLHDFMSLLANVENFSASPLRPETPELPVMASLQPLASAA